MPYEEINGILPNDLAIYFMLSIYRKPEISTNLLNIENSYFENNIESQILDEDKLDISLIRNANNYIRSKFTDPNEIAQFQYDLALSYKEINKISEAKYWFIKSAAHGHEEAIKSLKSLK
jgi:TPR repeat protein